jgi:hypothetical protein
MTLAEAIEYFENSGFAADGDRGNEAWAVIKTALAELGTMPNKSSVPCGDCGKLLTATMECDNPECVRVIMRGHGAL